MLALALVAALAVPQAATAPARKAYGTCLNKMVQAKLDARLSDDAFKAAAMSGCAAEELAFRKALIDQDIALGLRRSDAESNANAQIDDYLVSAVETYKDWSRPH